MMYFLVVKTKTVYFSEQFEGRMYVLTLKKYLDGTVCCKEYIPMGIPSKEQLEADDR